MPNLQLSTESSQHHTGERQTIDGIEHKVLRFDSKMVLFPFGNGYGWKIGQYVVQGTQAVTLRWKVYDDNGPSPDKGFGTVTVNIAPEA